MRVRSVAVTDTLYKPCKYCTRERWATYLVQDRYTDVYVCGQHLTKAVSLAMSNDVVKVYKIDA